MIEPIDFAKYRAVLDDGREKVFAFVVVQGNGSISWEVVGEQQFHDATLDDLPQQLFEQVNGIFRQLNALGDFPDDEVPR